MLSAEPVKIKVYKKEVFLSKQSSAKQLPMEAFAAALHAIPFGSCTGMAHCKRYILSKTAVAGGKGAKLVAEALDGSDYISLNIYHLVAGDILKPCEMPQEKVVAFVLDLSDIQAVL